MNKWPNQTQPYLLNFVRIKYQDRESTQSLSPQITRDQLIISKRIVDKADRILSIQRG